MPTITPLPGKIGAFKIGAVSYMFTRWKLKFTLATGKVLHFNSQTDGNGNYWPTVFANFADGDGSTGGFVDHSGNPIPIGSGLFIGSTGTASFLWGPTDGFTVPILIKDNDMGSDAAATDPGMMDIACDFTGPPTRIYS